MSLSSPFGRYWLEEKIATGGMAEIFKAKLVGVEGFEKRVVIKRILPFWSERQDFISMLVDEAKVLVHLNHPNIVQVYELGRVGPTYFIAMEYVQGVDLRQMMHRLQVSGAELPQEVALSIIFDSLKGLHYAHERTLYDKGNLGIVHRDISPQNILLSVEGEIKVSDFGIAKAVTQTHETQTGVLKGKYAYMSPEQALGRGLDRRSDIFSMGIVLYEILTGNRLFAGTSDLETLEKVRKAEVPWPEASTAKFLPGLREVMQKALARERSERFQTAEEFAEALEDCLPQGRRLSTAKLAHFFQGVFGEEFSKAETEKRARDFTAAERQTQVSPTEEAETISLVEAPEAVLPAKPPIRPVPNRGAGSRTARRLPMILGLLWLGAAVGLAWWLVPQFRQAKEVPTPLPLSAPAAAPPLPAPIPAPVSAPVPSPSTPKLKMDAEEADVKKGTQKKVTPYGSLRINAIPWGRVTVAGLIGGQETPVVRSSIKVGVYSVTVSNPSMGKTVSTQVTVRPEATTVCTADFEGNARIRCH